MFLALEIFEMVEYPLARCLMFDLMDFKLFRMFVLLAFFFLLLKIIFYMKNLFLHTLSFIGGDLIIVAFFCFFLFIFKDVLIHFDNK
jgi:hypothetical protein